MLEVNLQAVKPDLTDPLPAGDYACRVAQSFRIRSRSGRPMLKFLYDVTEGPFKGKRLVDSMLLDHEAGLSRLKTLALRAGHPDPDSLRDTGELHGLTFVAKVAAETGDAGTAPPRPIIKAYRPPPSRRAAS
jgi:hypothetical protein